MTQLRSWLPLPLLSSLLLAVWLMMARSVSPGHLLLGGLLAILIPLFTHRFWDTQPRIKKPGLLLRYVLRMVIDIILANLHVAWLILNPWRHMNPAFVEYPLMLKEPFTITLLANTITLTPGTLSANVRMDHRTLLIHALDMEDEETLIETIRERYEKPLQEIYEC